jgi:hypothetical protein
VCGTIPVFGSIHHQPFVPVFKFKAVEAKNGQGPQFYCHFDIFIAADLYYSIAGYMVNKPDISGKSGVTDR